MKFEFHKTINVKEQSDFDVTLNHSRDVIQSLGDSEFKTPAILGFSSNIISYEFFDLKYRLDKAWINNTLDHKYFIDIGRLLSNIHCGSSTNLLHGDFVLHNIFFNTHNEICVIDCHPPEVIGFSYDYLYGNQMLEMYLFLMNLPSSYGLKLSIKNPNIVRQAIRQFRKGYGRVRDIKSFILAIFRFYNIRRSGRFSVTNALLHLVIAVFFIVSAYD